MFLPDVGTLGAGGSSGDGGFSLGSLVDGSNLTSLLGLGSGGGAFGSFLSTAVGGFTPMGFLDLVGFDYQSFLGNTIGQVLTDGLSCWNSTFTPSKVKAELGSVHAPYFRDLFDAVATASSESAFISALNHLSKAVGVNYGMYTYLQTSANWQSCSKQSVAHYLTFVNNLKQTFNTMLANAKTRYKLTSSTQTVAFSKWVYEGYDFEWEEKTSSTYEVFVLDTSLLSRLKTANLSSFSPLLFVALLGIPLYNVYKNMKNKKKWNYDLLRLEK